MPTKLEGAIEALIVVFHQYASEDCGCYAINRDKMKQLMKTELPCYDEVQKCPDVLDKIMKDLNPSGANQLNFEQFCCLITGLSLCAEKGHEGKLRKMKKK